MKCFIAILLTAAAGYAADLDFNTGQAARLIIGQTFFTRQEPGASATLLGGVGGLAIANGNLYVADSSRAFATPSNNRVLIYNNILGKLPAPTDELYYTQRCPVCTGTADVVLGQPDFTSTQWALSQTGMRTPTAVATDGNVLVVADTDNNRLLIWKSIPGSSGAPADVVIGQPDFKTNKLPAGNVPNASSLRGPQGVWVQNGKLYVADTQDHRVLIWNSIPTTNNAPADVVLGQPDFSTYVEPDLTKAAADATATNLLNPVSVTADGSRLYVTDLGHNRVLIWNSIPTRNQTPADVVVGQPDMTSGLDNNAAALCAPTGQDSDGNNTYPPSCKATLDFPRYALSDGTRLFIADGGNDRVLIYNNIPNNNGMTADYVIGQLGGQINQASDAADSMRTPISLAWDGTNLYVSDSYNRRINVYTPGEQKVPYTGVRNAASLEIFAVGTVALSGGIAEKDTVTVTIGGTDYKYTIAKDDTFDKVVQALVDLINAGSGDPNVYALPNPALSAVVLTARAEGEAGNAITLASTTAGADANTAASITATASGANLSGGMDAAKVAPGTLVTVQGLNLSDNTESAPADAETLPTQLGGVQVYFDGVQAPLLYVSPDRVNAQVPFEFGDTTSINAYVRTARADGSISYSTPVAVTIVPQNPGIFAMPGEDPRPAIAVHSSSSATGTISVDGSVQTGDVATIKIEDRTYTYTVVDGDTLESIRDNLIALIDQDPKVHAYAAGVFTRIRLKARVEGPEGNNITYSASANDSAQVILTATGSTLVGANVEGSLVTDDNPAVPGETITVYAAGLGLPVLTDDNRDIINTGQQYHGPNTEPVAFVSSLAGGKTANVLAATLDNGKVGVYRVDLELNSDIPTDPFTQLTIAQDVYVSNIVTIPVVNPNPAPPAQ